jgi:glycosyltransferase involved in cell wall biosynthesis
LAALALALDKAASRPLLMHDIRENALRMLDDRFTLNNHMEMITKCYQRLLTPQAPNQPHPGV